MVTEIKRGCVFDIDKSNGDYLRIQFCHRDEGLFQHGVTNEDLLRMLIMRLSTFTNRDTSTENITATLHLKQALQSLEQRVQKKLQKDVTRRNG